MCIGGINAANAQRVLFQSEALGDGRGPGGGRALDGVAVVSAVVAELDPEAAARELARRVRARPFPFQRGLLPPPLSPRASGGADDASVVASLLARVPNVIRAVAERRPLSHNMTNLVGCGSCFASAFAVYGRA